MILHVSTCSHQHPIVAEEYRGTFLSYPQCVPTIQNRDVCQIGKAKPEGIP